MDLTREPSDPKTVAPEIVAYYAKGGEVNRLEQKRNRLERERTQELLMRHLPPRPATILDIGGATGAYARWLTSRAYTVHLIDPVPFHIAQAQQLARDQPNTAPTSVQLGDARHLALASASVDAVLLLGPLYHLTERADRLQALQEARRVVRPGGLVVAVGISRFASLFDGFLSELFDDPPYAQIVAQDLATGQHRNPLDRSYFTTAFLHHPDELRAEVEAAGLAVVDVVGIEGPGYWSVHDFDQWWNDPALKEQILAAARAVEHEPTLLGMGPHLMIVGRRG
ncbi:MAG TPA: class I SAM-dependent methyltransferase [Chloroflexota bacterium]|nr:class I SAM-dependent methyltransferase [Chloroflexota bacterium]